MCSKVGHILVLIICVDTLLQKHDRSESEVKDAGLPVFRN